MGSMAGGALLLDQWPRPRDGATPGRPGGSLDLVELVQGLQGRNLGLPLLIRFDDILEDRLERLHAAFERAIAQYGYSGRYQGCSR